MPRPAFFMGIVAGLGFALWYCIGVFFSRGIRKWKLIKEPKNTLKRKAWIALAAFTPLFIIATSMLARHWQNVQRALLEKPPIENTGVLTIVFMAILLFALLVLLQRGLAWVYRRVRAWVAKLSFLPPHIGTVMAVVVATVLIIGILTGILRRTLVVAIDSSYAYSNNYIDPSYPQPASELRSGSAKSAAKWEDLGREGRRFVARGPSANDIEKFTGREAKQPIRVYAGLNNAKGREKQVQLAIKELERTGAFNRKELMVTVPTGSGWIEPETVAAFEYMHGGDTAVVSAQYSYLPSGFALFLDQGEATGMAKELLHAVEAKLSAIPEQMRPKLVVYGLSLGSFGAQEDFTGEEDFASRLDGGLFVGTPGFSEPWRTITRERDSGSPQIKPIYNNEKVIKFATDSADVINDSGKPYKIVYFQYATDPFVWFDAQLLYAKPDWMREQPGRGVSPDLHWFPLITFTQVAIDQAFSMAVPGDNGHDYAHDTVAAMAAATKPNDWSADKTRQLQSIIAPDSAKN